MYRLNVCSLSSTFEKSFGLANFTADYTNLLSKLNSTIEDVNRYPYYSEYLAWYQEYRLFCKLSHFFDDFNFFINKSVAKRPEHDSKHSVDRRFSDFIQRVESMKIPKQMQDTIAGFLKMQRAKVAINGDMNIWQNKPKLYITDTQLEKLGTALNEEAEIGKDGLNRFDRTRAELLRQLATTLQKFPYIRLGQLISNSIPEGTDVFYVTDAKLIQLLKDFEEKNGLP